VLSASGLRPLTEFRPGQVRVLIYVLSASGLRPFRLGQVRSSSVFCLRPVCVL